MCSMDNEFLVGFAIQCLGCIGNLDLCRGVVDLVAGLMGRNGNGRVYLRKRAVAVMVRVFGEYPDAVRVCFRKLVESLEEGGDGGTLAAAVGVFCELVGKDPNAYIALAPEFYRVLVDCRNNWVLIKVLKLFARLAPLESRMADKVVGPVCDIMRRTMAKSLLFECLRTVVSSFSGYESAVKLAVAKIREFLVDDDPNLKYLGLEALSGLAVSHLWAVIENKDVVIKSLSDQDPNIRSASLRLVMLMVSEDNVAEISRVLINYALKSDPEFCNEILGSILATCSRNYYKVVFDFDWYVSLLGEMARMPHCHRGEEIESQLIDIGMRVKDARPELVRVARGLLIDPALLGNPFLHRILSAAAWVAGEYVELSNNPSELVEALLQPRTNLLPPSIRAVYIQSLFKILVYILHSYQSRDEPISELVITNDAVASIRDPEYNYFDGFNPTTNIPSSYEPFGDETQGKSFLSKTKSPKHESVLDLLGSIEVALGPLSVSVDVEIQERARNVLGLMDLVKQGFVGGSAQEVDGMHKIKSDAIKALEHIYNSLSGELGPVSATAQAKVTLPDGLVLEENLSALDTICGDITLPATSSFSLGGRHQMEEQAVSLGDVSSGKEDMEPSTESTSLLADHRKRHGLYYLPSEKSEALSNEYPPANDGGTFNESSQNDSANDLAKLTEESLVIKKKKSHAKPRPMVVRLEGEEVHNTSNEKQPSGDLISGAVREILQEENKSGKLKGKEKLTVDGVVNPRVSSTNVEGSSLEAAHTRSKHRRHRHGKDGGHQSHSKNEEKNEENGKDRKTESKRHHKSRHNVPMLPDSKLANPPVIPDLLL